MTDKILLGKLKKDAGTVADGQNVYLEKHKFDCGWYWGFGYLGNVHCHFHFNSFLKSTELASEIFESTKISDDDWWIIRDLFVQAYALKKVAEIYVYGGHQSLRAGVTDILKSAEKAKQANDDLEKLLDVLWNFIVKAVN